jgi:hypothetical protein
LLSLALLGAGCGFNLFQGNEVDVSVENDAADPLTVAIKHGSCASGAVVTEATIRGVSLEDFAETQLKFDRTDAWSLCVNGVLEFDSSEYDPDKTNLLIVIMTRKGEVSVYQNFAY